MPWPVQIEIAAKSDEEKDKIAKQYDDEMRLLRQQAHEESERRCAHEAAMQVIVNASFLVPCTRPSPD
jgi:hypothetical protein